MQVPTTVLAICVLLLCWTTAMEAKPLQFHSSSAVSTLPRSIVSPNEKLVALRGGDSKAGRQIRGKKPTGAYSKLKSWLATVQPVSRAYILLAVFCSVVHLIGLPAPVLFSLDLNRFYELWRPFTAVAYLGPPSMSMANNLFFLLRFGQTLETEQGPGPFAWYLLVQTMILTMLGWFLGFPFQAQAMISSIIHVCSRMSPMEPIPFQFGLMITSWQLPFWMMAIDCLSQQSVAPAWPHLLGIFSGHVFLFATKIWPALGGTPRLQTPTWIIRWLGDKPASNVPGLDFKAKKQQQASPAASKRHHRRSSSSSWFGGWFRRKATPTTAAVKAAPAQQQPAVVKATAAHTDSNSSSKQPQSSASTGHGRSGTAAKKASKKKSTAASDAAR